MRARRFTSLAGACVVAAAVSATGLPVAHAAGPVLPSADPFYTYAGTAPLASIAPGTVLNTRAVTLALNTSTTPVAPGVGVAGTTAPTSVPATQLLYRTQDELGKPTVTVTTVLAPAANAATSAATSPNIVAYLSFYDSLSPKCDPSYTLQGGDPGQANTELSDLEQGLVAQYYALGDVVTVPDFEGEGLHWTAGHEAGYDTLDAIKATENFLKAPASSKVALSGYSGGSIAADFASELAPTYAPSINLVGVAEAGVPVDFAHNLTYIQGSAVWSGIMAAVLDALSRATNLNLPPYLNDTGTKLTTQDATECIGDFSGTTPGLRIEQLLKPQYTDILKIPAFVNVLNSLIMGQAGTPNAPLFMGVGNDPNNAQGQGDDIMVTNDVVGLAHEYCTRGVTVDYKEYPNSTHEQAALQFEPDATSFITQRFAGAPATNNCSTIATGNSLAPIVLKAASTSTAGAAATNAAAKAAAAKKAAAKKAAAKKAAAKKAAAKKVAAAKRATHTAPTQATGTLAYTGRGPAAGIMALLLLAVAGFALRFRRRSVR